MWVDVLGACSENYLHASQLPEAKPRVRVAPKAEGVWISSRKVPEETYGPERPMKMLEHGNRFWILQLPCTRRSIGVYSRFIFEDEAGRSYASIRITDTGGNMGSGLN